MILKKNNFKSFELSGGHKIGFGKVLKVKDGSATANGLIQVCQGRLDVRVLEVLELKKFCKVIIKGVYKERLRGNFKKKSLRNFRTKKAIQRLKNEIKTDRLANHVEKYPAPSNLSFAWGFGSLLFLAFVIQVVSGLLLLTHYTPDVDGAFESVADLREVWWGWLLRNIHAGGASSIFLFLYIHVARGFYFRSYRRGKVWTVGIILFLLSMGVGFCGYVLPWGQMSFWGANVITKLIGVIPVWGDDFVLWLWGGFSVGKGTLRRFLTLHFFGSIIILVLMVLHIKVLHDVGSSRPTGKKGGSMDMIRFRGKYASKDILGLFLIGGVFICVAAFIIPHFFGHPDNFIKADPSVTPAHIQPEWYFLPFYAMLRAMPSKTFGVVVMGGSLLVCFTLPLILWFFSGIDKQNSMFGKIIFWIFAGDFIFLFWLGAQPIEEPYIFMGMIATAIYFSYFFFLLPLCFCIEIYVRWKNHK